MDFITERLIALLLEYGDEIAAITVIAGLICWWISAHRDINGDNGNGRDAK
jgi:hypothetical protein